MQLLHSSRSLTSAEAAEQWVVKTRTPPQLFSGGGTQKVYFLGGINWDQPAKPHLGKLWMAAISMEKCTGNQKSAVEM